VNQRIEPIGRRTDITPVTAPVRLTAIERDEERRRREQQKQRPKPAAAPDPGDDEEPRVGSRLDVRG